jgi:hypothetical protein
MRQAGAEVKYPIVVPDPSVLVVEDESPIKVIACKQRIFKTTSARVSINVLISLGVQEYLCS